MKINYILLLLFTCCVVSCKSVEKIVRRSEIPVITENRLLKNIDANELEYNTLYSKRMDVTAEKDGKSSSFRTSLRIQRDSFIWISVTAPLGIEVGRVLLTPDSIKFIDSFNRKYFLSDYKYLYDKFDINLNYDCFQKLLTNVFFDFENCNTNNVKEHKYKFNRTNDDYILSTIQERALNRMLKKLYKKKLKNKEVTLILQKIHIDPIHFRPTGISLEDMEDHTGVGATYMNFKDYNGKLFPEKLILNLFSSETNINVEMKFTRLEFNVPVESNFKIPNKYKRVY